MAVAPACVTNARLSATAALIRDRICLMGWELSKLLPMGGGDCEEREKPSRYFRLNPPSFINIVEPNEFPAALGQFKNEANRCVFPVLWRFLKRTVDVISPVGFLVRFGAGKTLGGIGLAFENFIITARELLLVLYRFYPMGHRQWEFRHLRDRRLIAGDNRRLKFLPECRKVGLRKREWRRMNLIPTL